MHLVDVVGIPGHQKFQLLRNVPVCHMVPVFERTVQNRAAMMCFAASDGAHQDNSAAGAEICFAVQQVIFYDLER